MSCAENMVCLSLNLTRKNQSLRSEEHTSELQSPEASSYAVFCLKKKKNHLIFISIVKKEKVFKNKQRMVAVSYTHLTQEILQPGGIYYGQNAVSKNLLVADRKKLMNGNSFRCV